MLKVQLPAQERDLSVKARDYRLERKLPGVVYGHGKDSRALLFEYEDLRKAYIQAGETTIVELEVGGKKLSVLFKDVQFHPVTDKIQHVDFYEVNLKEPIAAFVPIEFIGTAPAVRELGGVLSQQLTEIEVKCLPDRIPHAFQIDVTPLVDFHSSVHVSDLVLPEGVTVLTDAEFTIVTVSAPSKQEEDTVSPAEAEAAAIAEAAGEEATEGEDKKEDSAE